MTDHTQRKAELEKVRQALAAQEGLRGILDDAQVEASLAALREKEKVLLAQLAGDGAIAQGDHATALGSRAVQARDVGGHVITGDGTIINPDPAQAEAGRAEARYLKRVYQQCNVLPLAAMGGEEGVGETISLDEVYVALDTRTRVPLSNEEKKQREGRSRFGEDRESRPLTALEAATQAPRLVLLGDPGSGKSTFVRQLAAWLAAIHLGQREPLENWPTRAIPVMVILRELAPQLMALDLAGLAQSQQDARLVATVRAFLSETLAACRAEAWDDCLEDTLQDGQGVLIFDGLDEVPEAGHARVRQAVAALLRRYPKVQRVIVTCRVRSYTQPVALPGFTAHTLAPFSEDKVRDFVAAWYRAQAALACFSETEAASRTDDLQQAALNDDLKELASNPMLLTTMALIHQKEVDLPKERVRLYTMAVQNLLTRWQKRKGLTVSLALATILGDDLKLRRILEFLAHEVHARQAQGAEAWLLRKDLLVLLEDAVYLSDVGVAGEFLDYVDRRAGLLLGEGGDENGERPQAYSFPHRTFQEYLTGCYLVGQRGTARVYWQRAGEGDYWALAAQLGAEELLYNRRNPPELLDLAYALAPPSDPDDERAWRATVWSGRMAALIGTEAVQRDEEQPDGGAHYLARVIPRLVRILRDTPLRALERAEAGQALATLGDPRFRADAWYLPDDDDLGFIKIASGTFTLGEGKEAHPVTLPDYYIGQYPVTNAQFTAFVQDGGYAEPRYWPEAQNASVWNAGYVKAYNDDEPRSAPQNFGAPFNLANHPVVGITWYEMLAYCRWLTERLRECTFAPVWLHETLHDKGCVTLPSEAEWEKAARGPALNGAEGPDGRSYPWGKEPDPDRANYSDTGIGATSAVGCFPGGASLYGVEDFSGNVWEWTRSHWEDYPYRADDGREDLAAGINVPWVLRGGAFLNSERDVRCAYRLDYLFPDLRNGYIGFRVVVSPSAL